MVSITLGNRFSGRGGGAPPGPPADQLVAVQQFARQAAGCARIFGGYSNQRYLAGWCNASGRDHISSVRLVGVLARMLPAADRDGDDLLRPEASIAARVSFHMPCTFGTHQQTER